MAAFTRQNLTQWLAPAGGGGAGLITVATFLLMPIGTLEMLVWRSGIAALLPVAAPPLGSTARVVLALGGGMLAAAIVWSALFLLIGPGGFFDLATVRGGDVPVLRKADAHPDAPPRKPLSAIELGAPMPPVAPPSIQELPADLDQPLAAFDPAAVPAVPMEPVRAVAPLRPAVALAQGERIASVELPTIASNDAGAPSIETLLRRLEQGTRQRAVAR